jgi:hypothetical protein
MENIDLTFADEARGAVARKAIEHKTGARGLRSILESILIETMFDLPGLEGVEEVVISREVVEGTARPLYIYADRSVGNQRHGVLTYRTRRTLPFVFEQIFRLDMAEDLAAAAVFPSGRCSRRPRRRSRLRSGSSRPPS